MRKKKVNFQSGHKKNHIWIDESVEGAWLRKKMLLVGFMSNCGGECLGLKKPDSKIQSRTIIRFRDS